MSAFWRFVDTSISGDSCVNRVECGCGLEFGDIARQPYGESFRYLSSPLDAVKWLQGSDDTVGTMCGVYV